MTLSPAFLDELRARTVLSALVGRTVKLQRAGNEFRAPCPFHNEKTPSFYVNDDKAFYHCFGCGAHGDAIRWMTDQRGLPFIEAVKELAAAAGMDMPAPDPRTREREERAAGLHDVVAAAQGWFVEQLASADGAAARAYLDKRGIAPALAREFGFGFAPDGRGRLRSALSRFGDAALVEAGLLIQPEGERDPYDRFRGRLTLPIRDPRGRVIGFGGRILDTGEPKYLNSPETPLFDKGRTLYNLDRAAAAVRGAGRVVVVEGYLDVVALAGVGIGEAVAPLGTALTEAQIERLWRLADVPILCFDGDTAGRKAAVRAALRALPLVRPGKSLAFATLPAGQDPDDLARTGGRDAVEAVLAKPVALVDLLFGHEAEALAPLATPEARAGLRERLDALAAGNPNKLVADEYRRYFRDLFFQHYGWKPAERVALRGAVAAALPPRERPIDAASLRAMFVAAALLGLVKRPRLAARLAEPMMALQIADPALDRLRGLVVGAAIARPNLDEDWLGTILAEGGVVAAADGNGTGGLGFAFLRPGEDDAFAAAQLAALIEFLVDEQAMGAELARLDQSAIEDVSAANYEAVEARRRLIRAEQLALLDRAYDLGADGNG